MFKRIHGLCRPAVAGSIAIAISAVLVAPQASATLIGYEGFDYSNGDVVPNNGGTGWHYNGQTDTQGVDGGKSSWRNEYSSGAQVVNGQLQTQNNAPERMFNDTRVTGALRNPSGTVLYVSTLMTYAPGAAWMGLSVMDNDWGIEQFKFGANDADLGSGTKKYLGVEDIFRTDTWHYTGIEAIAGQTYLVVGAIDWGNDIVKMWVNPGVDDVNSPDVSFAYTEGNWLAAVRPGSGGSAPTSWDDIRVGTAFTDVVVPEPASLGVLGVAAVAMLRRGRRA